MGKLAVVEGYSIEVVRTRLGTARPLHHSGFYLFVHAFADLRSVNLDVGSSIRQEPTAMLYLS